MGLSLLEFYSMTWGNFQRASLGYVKRQWVVNREIIAAIMNGPRQSTVFAEDIFPFGYIEKIEQPSESDRKEMEERHNKIKQWE